ncbi:MAG: iron ABC transporter permease [Ignavibacteria bacterium]|nr:iron ABC transporter permease [Ignavibacteria bacterium]
MKKKLLLISLFFILLASIFVSVLIGSVNIPVSEIFRYFASENEVYRKIIYEIRLPRVLNAVLVGASLACSGIILQSLLKNNLAEPGLLGISSGAGLGAILIFIFSSSIPFYLVTPVSFVFAISATLIVFILAKGLNYKYTNFIHSNKIILAGIAINAFLSSINGFLLIVAGKNVSQILFWLSGGLAGRGWDEFYMTSVFALIGLTAAVFMAKELNILSLGEELAVSLGLNLKLVQRLSIIIASLLAASAVAVAGIVSFVGLIVPNISKMLVGQDYRYAIPCSIILGALLMVFADTVSRLIILPSELPAGIVISFIGAPIFIWLILRNKQE